MISDINNVSREMCACEMRAATLAAFYAYSHKEAKGIKVQTVCV